MFCRCYFLSSFFNGLDGDQSSQKTTGPIFFKFFRIITRTAGHDQSDLFAKLKGRCYGNRCLAQIGENWCTPPSFCALALTQPMTRLRLIKKLVNSGPVTPEFCGCICATRWVLVNVVIQLQSARLMQSGWCLNAFHLHWCDLLAYTTVVSRCPRSRRNVVKAN